MPKPLMNKLIWFILVSLMVSSAQQHSQHPTFGQKIKLDNRNIIDIINGVENTESKEGRWKLSDQMPKFGVLQKIKFTRSNNVKQDTKVIQIQIKDKSKNAKQEIQIINQIKDDNPGEKFLQKQQKSFVSVNETTIVSSNFYNYPYMTLTAVDVKTKKNFTKSYNFETNNYCPTLKLIDENTIGCSIGNLFLFINVSNLQIKQQLRLYGNKTLVDSSGYSSISSYYKVKDGILQNVIVLSRQYRSVDFVIEYNWRTKRYQKINEINKPNGPIYFTNSDEVISISSSSLRPKYNLIRFKSLREKLTVFREQSQPVQMNANYVLAVSRQQNLIIVQALKIEQLSQIRVYSFNATNYQRKLKFALSLNSGVLITTHAQLTNDNKYVIGMLYILFYKIYYGIVKVNVENQSLSFIKPTDQSPEQCYFQDFGIVDNKRFVAISSCYIQDEDRQKNAIQYYQLRLYDIQTEKIIDSYNITTDYVKGASIKANQQYNYTFSVHLKSNWDEQSNDCKSYVFKIKDNKIVSTNVTTNALKLNSLQDCDKYLVCVRQGQSEYSILDINTFQVIKKISPTTQKTYLTTQNSYAIVLNDIGGGLTEIFDLSKLQDKEWQKCRFFGGFSYFSFVFNSAKYFYSYEYEGGVAQVYDVQKCLINQFYTLQGPTDMVVYAALYRVEPKQQKYYSHKYLQLADQSCNKVYIMTWDYCFIFEDCKPYKPYTQIDFNFPDKIQFAHNAIMSSNNEFIIIVVRRAGIDGENGDMFSFDVRSVHDLSKSLYRSEFMKSRVYNADITKKGQLAYTIDTGLFVEEVPALSKYKSTKEGELRMQTE